MIYTQFYTKKCKTGCFLMLTTFLLKDVFCAVLVLHK